MIIFGVAITHEFVEFVAFFAFKCGILIYAAYDIHVSIGEFIERFIHHIR